MKCLIVDDEALARDVIETYIEKVDFLQLAGKCNNALQAFSALNKQPVDLMFLDIKMPEMTGLEFIRTLKAPPKIIITTAFHEYALDGFELDVVDYLLKPISFERFLRAIHKVKIPQAQLPGNTHEELSPESFYVRSDRKLVKINPIEIIFIESLKNYLCIYTGTQKVIVLSTMQYLEEQLKQYPFILRVHKSFLINKNLISEIDNGILRMSSGNEIPLGGLYKDSFLDAMKIL
jgi:DNA-binding LytR/AlgR family response regulator